ncbi:MAG: hypothetical protein ACYC3A_11385 [Halothiobacillus sp.]
MKIKNKFLMVGFMGERGSYSQIKNTTKGVFHCRFIALSLLGFLAISPARAEGIAGTLNYTGTSMNGSVTVDSALCVIGFRHSAEITSPTPYKRKYIHGKWVGPLLNIPMSAPWVEFSPENSTMSDATFFRHDIVPGHPGISWQEKNGYLTISFSGIKMTNYLLPRDKQTTIFLSGTIACTDNNQDAFSHEIDVSK